MFLDKRQILEYQKNANLNTPNEKIGHNDDVHENETERYTQSEWMLENIPFIETPDGLIDKVYYFRWKNLLACMAKRKEDGRYEFCESAPGSNYHRYIDCAQGAHIRDARWIRNSAYLNDYLYITPDKTGYREYLTDSVYEKYLLDGDREALISNYDKLKARFHSLDDTFDSEFGLYHCQNGVEGQEAGVNGFDKIERLFTYKASFIADNSSLAALTDNKISGEFWSCEGSQNETDSITVDAPIDDFYATGVRVWFKTEPKAIRVFYRNEGEWLAVENQNVTAGQYDKKITEITFQKVATDGIKIEFDNDIAAGIYASAYELVVSYTFEPWGCPSFWLIIGGDNSYRMNLNCFQSAAAYTLSKIAALMGNYDEEKIYREKGDALKNTILNTLWDDKISYFVEITNVDKHRIVGKESNCYSAWSFNLAPDDIRYGKAWDYALSEDYFFSKFGLTTLEKNNPHYMQTFGHGCLWNGPVWPYTFSMILCGMANLLNNYKHHTVTNENYHDLLHRFALCHYDNNSDCDFAVREDHHPEENRWIAQAKNYNHSTFVDNVLNGLLGIRPTEEGLTVNPLIPKNWDWFCVTDVKWCGKDVTVVYDKTGEKYGVGKGISVFINGTLAASSETLCKLEINK